MTGITEVRPQFEEAIAAAASRGPDYNMPEPWAKPDPASSREVKRRMLDVAAPYPDKMIRLEIWDKPKRPEALDRIEGYILEAVLCNSDFISHIIGTRRVALRRTLEGYFGHDIPDAYFTNPLSTNSRTFLKGIIEAEGIALKKKEYKTLKALLLALAARSKRTAPNKTTFKIEIAFTADSVVIGSREYPLHSTASGRFRIGRGNSKLPADALFELLAESHGEPESGRPAWLCRSPRK
jgi:hypothetical protein